MLMPWKVALFSLTLAMSAMLAACGGSGNANTTTQQSNMPPPASPDFSLAASPAALSLTGAGAAQTVQVSATALNGFTGQINVAVGGLPAGVTASLVNLALTPGTTQTISLTAAANAAANSAVLTFAGTSGTLSHSAQVTLTVIPYTPPPQSFTLSANPANLTLVSGGVGQQTAISATGVNGFNASVNITLSGLPAGVSYTPASLSLAPATPLQITLSAAASAPAGTANVSVQGASGTLTASTQLSVTVSAPVTSHDVTTYHDDVARTGQNLNETVLTLTNVNVNTFGEINFLPADGKVDAEPLYLQNLVIGGQTHNVLYVGSEHDSVYAFDADTGTQLWTVSLLETGETTSDDHGCSQITPEIGITATPVIDRSQGAHGSIFVVGMSEDSSGNYHQRLHALDLTTGAELAGSPTEVQASYPGNGAASSNGVVPFNPGSYAERAGLLLLNGSIYIAWTSHCDQNPYTGWLMAYNEQTLQQTAVLNLTPNGSEGAIWMSGAGLAADPNGYIYFLDANGTFDTTLDANGFPIQQDFGNAFLKVSAAGGTLAVSDYFALDNTAAESADDVDLGSGGALILPDAMDANGQVHQLAVGAGKDTNMYVVDRNNMGKFSANTNGAIYQELPGALPGGVFAMPAYFNNAVYYGAVGDPIQEFPIVNAMLAATPTASTGNIFVSPGATPGISANGASNGIVWAVENTSPAILYAYNAATLQELYDSTQAPVGRDSFGAGNKFITPLIANGKVYVGTQNGVAVFGLLP
jgi:outer membrane protein assembly factor BamB